MKNQPGRVWYTIYSKKTDQVVAFGTAKECCKAMGITRSSFYSIVSRTFSNEHKSYEIVKEKIDPKEAIV